MPGWVGSRNSEFRRPTDRTTDRSDDSRRGTACQTVGTSPPSVSQSQISIDRHIPTPRRLLPTETHACCFFFSVQDVIVSCLLQFAFFS